MILKVHDYHVYFSVGRLPAVPLMSVIISKSNIDSAGDIMILILGVTACVYKIQTAQQNKTRTSELQLRPQPFQQPDGTVHLIHDAVSRKGER